MADIEEAKGEEVNTDPKQKSQHWLASFFIYIYEFGERAAFYTIKASMPMFAYMYLEYSKTSALVIYHTFEIIASFSCLLGAISADGHIGKFRTVLLSSVLYFLGLAFLIVSAIPKPYKHIFGLVGLIFCAVACGSIRPTIAAFGGDQFPESSYQKKLLLFFVIYVAVSHMGKFFGQILTPVLRDFKPCYKADCYLVPFVSGLMMLACAIVSLLFGQSKCRMVPVKRNVVILALMAIAVIGILRKIRALRKRIPAAPHWLDHAIPECGAQIVEDTKILIKLLLLTLPAPLFFIVYSQTGSNWVFQAAYMNRTIVGDIQPTPELIVLIYPLFAIAFIPIYYFVIYQILNLLRMRSLVQKITIGGILATISMALAAAVELHLEKTQLPPPQKGICQFRIYNGLARCNLSFTTDIPENHIIRVKRFGYFENLKINVRSKREFTYNLTSQKKASMPMFAYMYLDYSKASTLVIYYTFEIIASFSCLLGAISADGHIGKFRTVLFSSMLYFLGLAFLIVSAIPKSYKHVFGLVGLVFCAVACGSIRPTIAAFGGDQFPESSYQKKLLLFFVIYVAISHMGKFFGQILTPVLRDFKPCYKADCYLVPFVSGLMMLACAIVSLLFGQSKCRMVPVKRNVVILALMAIAVIGIVRKIQALRKRIPAVPHWLDHAIPECGAQIVEDTKILIKLLLLTLPAPLFFIIYSQTGSNWVFQAGHMNRTIVGDTQPTPELVVLIYPLFAIAFIPIYYFVIYPILNLLKMRSLVQKITIGGILATISMALAAAVELHLEKTQLPPPQSGVCQFRIYNGLADCDLTFTTDIPGNHRIRVKRFSHFANLKINVRSKREFTYNLTSQKKDCPNWLNHKFRLEERSAVSYFFTRRYSSFDAMRFIDVVKKPFVGAIYRILSTDFVRSLKINSRQDDDDDEDEYIDINDIRPFRTHENELYIEFWNTEVFVKLSPGDVIVILVTSFRREILTKTLRIAPSSTLSVYWLIPQYIFLAMADVILTISVLHFAYVTAPASMKTLFIGCWYMTILLGNLLLIIILKLQVFTWKKYEYIFYAALMFVGTVVFAVVAYLYQTGREKDVEEND